MWNQCIEDFRNTSALPLFNLTKRNYFAGLAISTTKTRQPNNCVDRNQDFSPIIEEEWRSVEHSRPRSGEQSRLAVINFLHRVSQTPERPLCLGRSGEQRDRGKRHEASIIEEIWSQGCGNKCKSVVGNNIKAGGIYLSLVSPSLSDELLLYF